MKYFAAILLVCGIMGLGTAAKIVHHPFAQNADLQAKYVADLLVAQPDAACAICNVACGVTCSSQDVVTCASCQVSCAALCASSGN